MKFVSLYIFLIFYLFSFIPIVFASAPQIIASPSGTINLDQTFTISATMSGLSKNAVYRLRIAIAEPGTTNYFGSTWNGANWYNGTPPPIQYAYFLSISTDATGSWSGDIQGKIDPDDPNFTTGSGTYDVKVGRYTQTGSSATWSETVPITIVVPDPTSLPSTPLPTAVPTAIPIQRFPTNIPKTPLPTVKPPLKITLTPVLTASILASTEAVLGSSSANIATPSPTTRVEGVVIKKQPVIFLLLGSIIVLAAAGVSSWFLFFQKKHGDEDNNDST